MASVECSKETEECTRSVFKAVNENSVYDLESARKTYSRLVLLTSLAQCNKEGETPLAIAIKQKSDGVDVVKEMMAILEDVLYADGLIRLKLKLVINQLFQQIPIKEFIDILIYDQYQCSKYQRKGWFEFVAKFLIKSIPLTRQDKINFLELIGSAVITQLIFDGDRSEIVSGICYWREAMTLRHFPTDGGDPLPKLPNFNVPSESSSIIFGSAVEVATIEELHLLEEDFVRNNSGFYWRFGLKRVLIQALLVIRRISAQEHLGHLQCLYPQSLIDYADLVFHTRNWQFLNKGLFILEELNGYDPNLFSPRSFGELIRTLDRLSRHFISRLDQSTDCFIAASSKPPNSPERRDLNYANLLIITKLATSIQPNHPHFQNSAIASCVLMGVIYYLVFILNSISSRITSQEKQILETFYYDYFRDFPERTRFTVLEMAIRDIYDHSTTHARLQTIQRILKLGADPNGSNKFGQTPLHYLAQTTRFTDEDQSVFQVLLDAGAHLDAAGDNGETVICILKEKLRGKVHPYFESLYNSVFPLTYLCARVIRRHGVPLDRLPPRLKKLVSSNSAEGKQIIDHSAFLAK
jgi:hypothetical protein